jgi:EAL domain-containing protein (putative c-di-GMP-specific phosphodiesterase class I)
MTDVADALRDSGMVPRNLVLEMTETALIADPAGAAQRLEELRRIGVQVAIDDFGTGYSSLAYLRQFAVDILKIDRSFVSCISEQAGLPALIRGLLDLARTLDLDVIAEGIEKQDQHDRLREGGCRLGQGYLFAGGLPEDQAAALLASPTPFERRPSGDPVAATAVLPG